MAGILTHEQKQLAFRLRGRGWRLVDIAREIGCSCTHGRLDGPRRPVHCRGRRRMGAPARLSGDLRSRGDRGGPQER